MTNIPKCHQEPFLVASLAKSPSPTPPSLSVRNELVICSGSTQTRRNARCARLEFQLAMSSPFTAEGLATSIRGGLPIITSEYCLLLGGVFFANIAGADESHIRSNTLFWIAVCEHVHPDFDRRTIACMKDEQAVDCWRVRAPGMRPTGAGKTRKMSENGRPEGGVNCVTVISGGIVLCRARRNAVCKCLESLSQRKTRYRTHLAILVVYCPTSS